MIVLEELDGIGEGDNGDDGGADGLAPEAVTEQALAEEADALLNRPKGRDVAQVVSAHCGMHNLDCYHTAHAAQVFAGHTSGVYALALSPNGADLASGSGDDTARVWNAATGECVQVLTGHGDSVTCVCFSHDGALLATASLDGAVRVWKRAPPPAAAAAPAADSDAPDAWLLAHALEGPTSDVEWMQWHPKGASPARVRPCPCAPQRVPLLWRAGCGCRAAFSRSEKPLAVLHPPISRVTASIVAV